MMKRLVWLALAAAGAAGIAAAVVMLGGPAGKADPDDLRQVALGRTVYEDNCASCHGATLEGQPRLNAVARLGSHDARTDEPPSSLGESGFVAS